MSKLQVTASEVSSSSSLFLLSWLLLLLLLLLVLLLLLLLLLLGLLDLWLSQGFEWSAAEFEEKVLRGAWF